MIEVEILNYLKSQNIGGIGENVHMETPEKEPEEYIRIMRTGGGTSDRMRTATFAIQSIGKTKFRSAEINQKVMKAMEDLNLPKTFQEQNMNIELNRIILNSIINVSKYINELFDKLINGNNDNQTYQSLLICLSALQQKINYFLQVKIHSFKMELNAINDIVILKHHLDYMNNCFQSELSQNLKDISNTLNELFIYVN